MNIDDPPGPPKRQIFIGSVWDPDMMGEHPCQLSEEVETDTRETSCRFSMVPMKNHPLDILWDSLAATWRHIPPGLATHSVVPCSA